MVSVGFLQATFREKKYKKEASKKKGALKESQPIIPVLALVGVMNKAAPFGMAWFNATEMYGP